MHPTQGRVLSRPDSIKRLWQEAVEQGLWVMQPKLRGDRVVLACIKGRVHAQNGTGSSHRRRIGNAPDFLRLPDGTCLDGIVFKGNFYPFECLASNKHSFLLAEVHERVRLAKNMVQFLKQPWLFDPPTLAWLMQRRKNRPNFDGVILKQVRSRYVPATAGRWTSLDWLERLWA